MKHQQRTFADNIISNEDYGCLKKRLKEDGNFFWYFIVRFLGATGARVSELVQIKAEHVRLGYMDLYSKGGKIRRIYFPDSLCQECLAWLSDRELTSGFIFLNRQGKPVTPRGINSQLKNSPQNTASTLLPSIPTLSAICMPKISWQNLTISPCWLILLGHESIETTKIYLTQTSTEQKTLIDRIIIW